MSTLKVETLLKKKEVLKQEEEKYSSCTCGGDPECGCGWWLQSVEKALEKIEDLLEKEE